MIELLITAQGIVRAIYTEAIPLRVLGSVSIQRASHVEPDASGNWWADLEPSRGPVLGPFTYRNEALQAEQDWITQHVLFGSHLTTRKVENLADATLPCIQGQPSDDTTAALTLQASVGGHDP